MPLETKETGRRRACAEAWTDPGSFATTLVTLFHDAYAAAAADPDDEGGPRVIEAYSWHPETILLEVESDFGVQLPRANFDRLMAGIHLLTSDSFYRNLPDFVDLCVVLAGGLFDPAYLDLPDAGDVAWAVTEALLLSPPDGDEPFSEEILAFIGKVADQEGITNPPDVLRLGTRDPGLAARVASATADDPEVSTAAGAAEAAKTEEINSRIKTGLRAIIEQLGRLDLADSGAAARARTLTHSRSNHGEADG
jgi:hypothetical protein